MSDLTEFRDLADELIRELGTSVTWRVPTQTYSDDGNVSETVASHTVRCSDMVDESERYGTQDSMQRTTGTIYVPALDAPVTPAIGHRVEYRGSTFLVIAVQPYAITGGDVMWRVDLSSVGQV